MNRHVLVLIGVLFIGIGLTLFIYHTHQVLAYKEIDIRFEVFEGKAGFLMEDKLLDFGRVAPGGGSTKRVTLEVAVPARYLVAIRGEAVPFIFLEPWTGELTPGTPTDIYFSLRIPENTSPGNYTGTAQVRILRR